MVQSSNGKINDFSQPMSSCRWSPGQPLQGAPNAFQEPELLSTHRNLLLQLLGLLFLPFLRVTRLLLLCACRFFLGFFPCAVALVTAWWVGKSTTGRSEGIKGYQECWEGKMRGSKADPFRRRPR